MAVYHYAFGFTFFVSVGVFSLSSSLCFCQCLSVTLFVSVVFFSYVFLSLFLSFSFLVSSLCFCHFLYFVSSLSCLLYAVPGHSPSCCQPDFQHFFSLCFLVQSLMFSVLFDTGSDTVSTVVGMGLIHSAVFFCLYGHLVLLFLYF